MTAAQSSVHLTFVSSPYTRRTGLIPMIIAAILGWAFVLVWLVVSICLFKFNLIWSLVLAASTSLFACYLAFFTWKLVADGFREYVFELTDTEAILWVKDRLKNRHSTQMVLLDDIKYAEYYPFQDSAIIIFHASYCQMEVPLWPLGAKGQDVVDFLTGRGVCVVNVQSDDQIPS